MRNKSIRCTACRAIIEDKGQQLSCCPHCKSTNTPQYVENDIPIIINTHDLHILFVWAENWARQIDKDLTEPKHAKLIDTLSQLVEAQMPSGKWMPLTLTRELRDLRENFPKAGKIELTDKNGTTEF